MRNTKMPLPNGVKECPKRVHFEYPEGTKLDGRVVQEVSDLYTSTVFGDYYMVIQRIQHEGAEDNIRFGYYRKKPGAEKFIWGSQTTYEFPVSLTKALLERAREEGILD
jgi:hypothetical protein